MNVRILLGLVLCAAARAQELRPGDLELTLEIGGRTRRALVHAPRSYRFGTPTPVVLAFHGGGGNAESLIEMSRLDETADREGFLVVYPDGTGRFARRLLTWNAGLCCGWAAENGIDDVAFVRALLDDLTRRASVDPDRIYATGMSNGAMMCYRLAAELSDRIAAIAPVAGGTGLPDPKPGRPVPIVHFHGTADQNYPFEGGVGDRSLSGTDFVSIPKTIAAWVAIDGCPAEPEVTRLPDATDDDRTVRRERYGPGKDGAEVVLYVIEGGTHSWPGGPVFREGLLGEPTTDISANDIMWAFFQAHPLR